MQTNIPHRTPPTILQVRKLGPESRDLPKVTQENSDYSSTHKSVLPTFLSSAVSNKQIYTPRDCRWRLSSFLEDQRPMPQQKTTDHTEIISMTLQLFMKDPNYPHKVQGSDRLALDGQEA